MKRRHLLLGGAVVGLAGGAGLGLGTLTFRWHSTPRRRPYLTEAHLQSLLALPRGAETRVLFIGNSMTLAHDLPQRVAARAAAGGQPLQVAVAAARGSRLIETWRLDGLRAVLETGWDVLVLQDFSTTSLRAVDRWGSAHAMRAMAAASGARGVLLFPTWAFPPAHAVYETGAGRLSRPPDTPEDFARHITAHYGELAVAEGWRRAPVTEAFQPDATPYLEADLHHPNPRGTDLIADVLWDSLRDMVPAR